MKYFIFSILVLGFLTSCNNKPQPKKKPLSPHTTAMAMIGDAHIHIDYSSPGVRGRTIFGELIPYGKLWRAGANNATWIETNKDISVAGQSLSAGKYGLFVIPGETSWTLIINNNWDQHGTDEYKSKDDVMKIEVQPVKLEEIKEHLLYQVEKTGEQSGKISLVWEHTKVELPFTILP